MIACMAADHKKMSWELVQIKEAVESSMKEVLAMVGDKTIELSLQRVHSGILQLHAQATKDSASKVIIERTGNRRKDLDSIIDSNRHL